MGATAGTLAHQRPPRLYHCDIRFGGYLHENVRVFVEEIQRYKTNQGICDASALSEMKELLYGHAWLWWNKQRKQKTLKDWNQALTMLIEKFKRDD